MKLPAGSFAHLDRLTDGTGIFEHAEGVSARTDGGYCLDDAARALVVVCRESAARQAGAAQDAGDGDDSSDGDDGAVVARIGEIYLSFVLAAQAGDGRFHNRLSRDGRWEDTANVEDCWGRALWGLGTFLATPLSAASRDLALQAFTLGARWRSRWRRSMALAALGAAEVLTVLPDHHGARSLLADAARRIGRPRPSASWPWPEDRLAYANAALPEVLIAAGVALSDASLRADGLLLLEWLLVTETSGDHLSVTPVGGRGQTDTGPLFDQQPIEVAALADACARAYAVTGDGAWADAVELALSWFLGANDAGTPLQDPVSGGGCDGLERLGRNENQGAESTLALLSTLQQGRRILVPSR
jgi:hypothetical protein